MTSCFAYVPLPKKKIINCLTNVFLISGMVRVILVELQFISFLLFWIYVHVRKLMKQLKMNKRKFAFLRFTSLNMRKKQHAYFLASRDVFVTDEFHELLIFATFATLTQKLDVN